MVLIPHALILDQTLDFSARYLCSYLYFRQADGNVYTLHQMADSLNLSVTTIRKCADTLEDAGYIIRQRSLRYHQIAYFCKDVERDRCVPIPKNLFEKCYTPSTFCVLLFILYRAWSEQDFPSLRQIVKNVDMSISTVCRCLKEIGNARQIYAEIRESRYNIGDEKRAEGNSHAALSTSLV